jgi:hypothetical protein|tara:strand:- start:208 stop:345 length:138 start_codon:yes stop_codon:yes gene_type:complete
MTGFSKIQEDKMEAFVFIIGFVAGVATTIGIYGIVSQQLNENQSQ